MFKKVKAFTSQVNSLSDQIATADHTLLKHEAEYREHAAKLSGANATVTKLQAQVGQAQVKTSHYRSPRSPPRSTDLHCAVTIF